MGRMFRVITDGGDLPADFPPSRTQLTMNPYSLDAIPFVEVGGPEGVVTSPYRAAPVRPAPEPIRPSYRPPAAYSPPPQYAPPTYAQPQYAPPPVDPNVLSVAFHKMPQPGLRLVPTDIAPEVVAYHHPDHPVSAEYRLVREEIRRQFTAPTQRTVLFTSGNESAGTTTVTLNVAVALAQDARAKVLVVDANPARPSVAARLGVNDAPGLSDVLTQAVPLAWAIQGTTIPNVHVMACGSAAGQATQLVAHELPRLLAQVRQWFDWILVDIGVWEQTFGRTQGAGTGDAVYLVTRHTDLERMEFHTLRGAVGPNLKGYITTRH